MVATAFVLSQFPSISAVTGIGVDRAASRQQLVRHRPGVGARGGRCRHHGQGAYRWWPWPWQQFGFDLAGSAARACLGLESVRSRLRLWSGTAVDGALTPVGLALAFTATDAPFAFLLGYR